MSTPTEHQSTGPAAAETRPPNRWLGRWIGQLSISRKLAAMVLASCLIVAGLLVVVVAGVRITDAVRSYVGGEGLWSKAQKSAVYHLNRYTLTADPQDFARYEAAVAVTLSYRRARLELEKVAYDWDVAAQGFIGGGSPAEEVPNMIAFFRNFRDIHHVDKAISIWTEGDARIDELIELGENLHASQRAGGLGPAQRQAFLDRIDAINEALTPLEAAFSETLSTAARWAHALLLKLIVACAAALLAAGLWVSLRIAWQIRQGVEQLRRGAEHVARGDMEHRIPRVSDDELGDLASSFNEMIRLRHEAEVALEHERRFLQVCLENLAEAVIACDARGRLWLFNRAARDLHGLPAEPIAPEQWAEHYSLFATDGQTPLALDRIPLYQALQGQRVLETEMVVKPRGRAPHTVLASAQALISDTGQKLGAVVTLHDVTERRRAETALADHARELEQANAELEHRNLQLRRLYQAEAASEAKSRFVATLSHEIRTPLHGILGLLETFDAAALSAPQRERLGLMHQSGRLLKHLIDDILDFAKIEAGRVDLEQLPLCLPELVNDVCDALQPAAENKHIALQRQIGALPGVVLGDAQRLRQVLLNLLSNAVKFTPVDGEVRLSLRVNTRRGQHLGLRFEVRDTGIGMDAEARDKVFESFVQAESSTTRRYGGTGLGLAICKGLVEQMGGSIGCESEPGQGSTFWFEIPTEIAEPVPEPAAAATTAAVQPIVGPRDNPLRLLIAEDNPINQVVIRDQLARHHCTVTIVGDGEAALAEVQRGSYQILITDLQMPRLCGMDLTRAIRQRERDAGGHGRLVIIGLTASAQKSTLDECRRAGMDDCLVKPLSLAQLDSALRRWSGKARQAA